MKQDKPTPKPKTAKSAKSAQTSKKPAKEPTIPSEKSLEKDTRKMNLEDSRTLISKILLGIVLFCLTFFFARTAVWEYYYYAEKEGSPRAVVENVAAEAPEELEETEVTETERYEYTVAPDLPRYLTIEKLGIHNARVLPMGINDKGELDTPRNIFDVGWYTSSSKPGGGGVLVIDGHNGGPNIEGVFKHINTLYEGDEIVVERGDGTKFTYSVVENNEIPLSEANEYMKKAFTSPVPGREAITLISCIGEWNGIEGTYNSRQFTHAVLKID